MLHVFYRLCAGFFFVFGCLACTSTPEPAITPVGTSISVPSSTATDLPIPTHTNTPEPTATATPTPTYTPEPLPITWSSIGQLTPVQQVIFPPPALILSLAWSSDGAALAVSTGEQVRLLAGDPLVEIRQFDTDVFTRALAFHPTLPAVMASGDNAGGIRIWDVNSGALLQSLQAHPKGVNQVAFQPGGKLLATAGNDAQAWLWDLTTGEQVAWFVGGVHAVPDLVFTPDGLSFCRQMGITCAREKSVSGACWARFVLTAPVYRLAVTPDGQTLVVGSLAGEIQTWDFLAGERLAQIVLPSESAVLSLAISPDGVLIAAGLRSGQLCFMPNTLPTGDLHCLPAHDRPVEALAFHPDGFTLVSGGYDGVLIAWQVDR
jgi:WD40 repeat protein